MPNTRRTLARLAPVLALICLPAMVGAAPAVAAVTVQYVNPGRFTDAGSPGGTALAAIKSYLERLGRRLQPGLDLTIMVLDVDLAGEADPFRDSVRVVRGAAEPRIKLRYTLTQGRKVIASGEEMITDPYFQSRIDTAASGDPQRYEKAMLGDWFRMRFAGHLR